MATPLLLAENAVAGVTYDVNAAFVANELGGTPVNPNGPYTYGYNFNPTTPSAISTSGLVHTGAGGFNGTGAGIQGFYYPNNALVPALLVNDTNSPIVTNFGTTMQAGQILLHPGGTTGDAFAPPIADAVLQYVVPSTSTYTVSGSYQALSIGDTSINIYINGVQAFSASEGPQGTVTPFLLTQTLAAGSTISFVAAVGPNGIGSNSTGLFANIASTPEPASLVVWGIGIAAGLVIARRRRKA